MHFWIDKPAGRNYGFGGRNFPCTSYAPKIKTSQRGRLGGGIGPMVTPVHRFQNLGPLGPIHGSIPGPSATTRLQQHQQHQEHQQHQQPQQQQSQQQQQQPPTVADDFIHRTEYNQRDPRHFLIRGPRPSFVRNNVTNAAAAAAAAAAAGAGAVASNNGSSSSSSNNNNNNERQILPNETTNNGLNSRSSFFEGHFSEISDTELAGYRLRCGVWITFVLATGFVSVAKFYFGNRFNSLSQQDAGLDMLIFCGLLFTLLLSGCFYSTLFRRAQNTHRHHQDHLDDQIATLTTTLNIRDEDARFRSQVIGPLPHSVHLQMQQRQQLLQLQEQQQEQQQQQQQQQQPPPPPPPPPPYHIAILIPPPNSPEEAPPPSYDKAMNEDSSNQTRVFIFSKDEDN